jgi:hypothetical protein
MTSFGSIAEDLMVSVDVITHIAHVAAVMVGIFLFLMAFSLFKAHRFNPKFVPLEKPILYAVLGCVAVTIPFLGILFGGSTGSIHDLKTQGSATSIAQFYDIDAPLKP